MKTCCSTRSRSPERSRRFVLAYLSLAGALGLALGAGCSDDVVCTGETTPYVAARIEEVGAARGGSTYVEVYCSSDPRLNPSSLYASVADRRLGDPVEAPDQIGFLMTLSDTLLVWQTGTSCLLEVTTEFGIASAQEVIPGAFEVTAPETVMVGETLSLAWTSSYGADYYRVQASHEGQDGEADLDIAVNGTSVLLDATEVGSAGTLSGVVWAVSGRFPQSGAAGNVAGEGWGYYTVSYREAGDEFEVVVRDASLLPRHQDPVRQVGRQ